MNYILETKNLSKKYKKYQAINNFNIHIEKGAIYGLIGRNGVGKTTLMRIITGLQKPTSGHYSIYGIENNSKEITKARKKIGAIIETPAICSDMTAKENLIEQSKIIGLADYKNIEEILKLIGLSNTNGKKAKNFSLGMKQRLAIGISLIGGPEFIILDEPINGLDPEGIIEIRELILKLNKEKEITFLISSHNLDELSKIATNYGFIDQKGKIKEVSSEEIKNISKSYIIMKVTNIEKCAQYLNEKKITNKIVSEEEIEIYEKVNISELVIELSSLNCTVNELSEKEESLEKYYLNLVGGAENE